MEYQTELRPRPKRGNRSRVYEAIISLLQTDPTLSSYFPAPDAWSVSNGESFNPEDISNDPHIYAVPRPSSSSWYGPDAMKGILQIDLYFWLPGNNAGIYNVFDALDMFETIEDVFYPVGDKPKQQAIRTLLQKEGATTGLIEFSQPATQQQTSDRGLVSFASIRLEVTRRHTP